MPRRYSGKVPSTDRMRWRPTSTAAWRASISQVREAAAAFAFVAASLPLPEVVNDEGVANSRQGKDAAALFVQVIAADPNDADYHFNLAVALLGAATSPGHARVEEALKLHADDPEAKELLARLQATHG